MSFLIQRSNVMLFSAATSGGKHREKVKYFDMLLSEVSMPNNK